MKVSPLETKNCFENCVKSNQALISQSYKSRTLNAVIDDIACLLPNGNTLGHGI